MAKHPNLGICWEVAESSADGQAQHTEMPGRKLGARLMLYEARKI